MDNRRIGRISCRRGQNDPACKCLVAVGGDGTVSALLNEHPGLPISVFPAGTENLVAQQFGLRRDAGTLARIIAKGHPRRVDVGSRHGRRFLLMVGFGFDGDIVSRHHHTRLSRLGPDPADQPPGVRLPGLAVELFVQVSQDQRADRESGCSGNPERHNRVHFQRATVCPGPSVCSGSARRRRLARFAHFSRSGRVQGTLLSLEGFSGNPSRVAERIPPPRQIGDRDRSEGTVPIQIDGDPGGSCKVRRRRCQAPLSPRREGTAMGWTVEIVPQALEVSLRSRNESDRGPRQARKPAPWARQLACPVAPSGWYSRWHEPLDQPASGRLIHSESQEARDGSSQPSQDRHASRSAAIGRWR